MPTENPKISAYVPQIIYDRFKEFKEERKLSFSQAAIEVFAEYFSINLVDTSTREFTGGLPDRIGQLEQIVADLKQSYIYLSQKVDLIQSTSGLPIIESDNNFAILQNGLQGSLPDNGLASEPLDELLIKPVSELLSGVESELLHDNLLTEQDNNLLNNSGLQSEFISKPSALLPYQLEIVESGDNKSSSLPNNLIGDLIDSANIKVNYSVLALRLHATEGYIRNKTSTSSSLQKFAEWSTKKDPDKIGWQPIKEGKKIYYSPSNELTDEQKTILQEWLRINQNQVD